MSDTAPTAPRSAELSLIRDFELCCEGEPVALAPGAQKLLAFLALQSKPVRRAYVSGTLWFDSDEQHAGASLRSALWRLNPLQLVRASNTHLSLNPCVEVDLHRVIERALDVLRSSPPESTLLATAQELITVGDDLLVGWYDDWVSVERERFRQIRLHAMDRIGERLIETGRWCDALQIGLAATSTEPLRESAQRLLVRVHLLQGNIAEAIRQYRSYAELLHTELNGRPSQGIQDLLQPFVGGATA